ncbi:MAG: glycoside hydrolase family 16 protein [Parabacteroides sp.]
MVGLFLLLVACAPSQKEWQLVWEDNFDQADTFDPAVWSKIPRGGSDWNNYMSDWDSLYAVREGNLVLRGIQNLTQPNDTAPYLTGGLFTKGKKGFMDGRLEIKAKLNGATGAWPAFWLLPEKGEWPMGGEIDIMERLSHDSIAYQTVHSHYTFDLGFQDTPPHGGIGPIDPADYNVYAVELYADSLCFYINDQHTLTYPRIETDQEGQFPFHQPFYLLLDMQLGGSWVGAVDPAELPVEMYIDWVKFYKK